MTTPVYWPRAVLRPAHNHVNPAPVTSSGPVSLSGFRQAVASPAAVWSITYDGVIVSSVAERRCMMALAALVEGRTTPIIVPIYERDEMKPLGVAAVPADVDHDDGAAHDDGTGYAASRTDVVVDGAVAAGANTMTLESIVAGPLDAGQHFSVGVRLYRIANVVSVVGAKTTVKVWPTVRESILDRSVAEFDLPVCKVRLVDDGGLDLALEHGRHGFPSISFIEDPS